MTEVSFNCTNLLGPRGILLRVFAAYILLCASFSLFAQSQFEEGKHYEVVPIPFEAEPTGFPIVVTEVFSYACPHCYDFESLISKWVSKQDPSKVKFERLHVIFSNEMVNLARAYAMGEMMGITEKVHLPIFSAIHKNGLRMNREDLLMRLFKNKADISYDEFGDVFSSPDITQKLRDNNGKARVWRILATPTMVIDGRYTTSPTAVNNKKKVLEVVDFLVQKVTSERESSS